MTRSQKLIMFTLAVLCLLLLAIDVSAFLARDAGASSTCRRITQDGAVRQAALLVRQAHDEGAYAAATAYATESSAWSNLAAVLPGNGICVTS